MAPRRGGGSSGGGGSGSSGIEDTPWGVTIEMGSTLGFRDPYNVARLVFQAIGLVSIIAIIIWANTLKKLHEPNKKLFKWWAFWLTAVALFVIHYQVEFVIGDPYTYRQLIGYTDRLATTYSVLYVFGSLEIMAWSVLGVIKKRTEHGQVSRKPRPSQPIIQPTAKQTSKQTHLIMLALIAVPLFLRSLYSMGDIIYEQLQGKFGGKRLWLATDIIYNLTSILIYAGIVAIARHFAQNAQQPGGANPTYDPNYTGLPPHDPAAKPNMAVHESAPPPVYQQGNHQPAQGHGNVQYTMPPPQPQHSPFLNHQQQQQQPYPTQQPQPQYQPQQQPYNLHGYYHPQSPPLPSQQHQPIHSTHSPQMSAVTQTAPQQQQQYRPAPSEVSGITSSTELPSPTHTPGPHAYVR
ncbi:MAG: hypothetical protein Q9221_005083 [Calogaya cf. arnoldii]